MSERLIAVHAVHLNEHEIALLAQRGASVAHCPASNLKLGSGLAPIASLSAAGVNIAIGTDGAASNNRIDMLAELRLAALLAKGVAHDTAAFGAPRRSKALPWVERAPGLDRASDRSKLASKPIWSRSIWRRSRHSRFTTSCHRSFTPRGANRSPMSGLQASLLCISDTCWLIVMG